VFTDEYSPGKVSVLFKGKDEDKVKNVEMYTSMYNWIYF
jgi:hypothetical protein